MFSFKKSLALAGATAVLAGLGLTAPAQAAPVASVSNSDQKVSQQSSKRDVGAVKNSVNSRRQLRMWKDDSCPNTLEGFKRSAVVYEGDWAPFPSVGSTWMGKDEVLYSSYWLQRWTSSKTAGRCINLTTSPSTVLKIVRNNSN